MQPVERLKALLNRMVNEQFETPEFQYFLSVPLTKERARFYMVQNTLYTKNRRDCWGHVQGAAPLEVKALVWEHESDELIRDPRCDMDHYSLGVEQGKALGLTREDFTRAEMPPMVRSPFYAWIHIAKEPPWLKAFASSQMLERRNNGAIIEGGGLSFRVGKRFENELGIKLEKLASLKVHSVADTDHSNLMDRVYDQYVKTQQDFDTVIQGATECMAIDRAYRGGLAYLMEQIE